MKKNASPNRKALVVGIIGAVVALAVILVLLLSQCTGGDTAATTEPTQKAAEDQTYELYWNVDRAEYDGKSEAGMSSRKPEADGYFHVRFFKDGEMVELKVADRKVVNSIDVNDLMGLEFDENGIVIGVIRADQMPLERVGWLFYVQSVGGNMVKINSSKKMNGLEVLLEVADYTRIYDMTGVEGPIGQEIMPSQFDRVIAIADLTGRLTHIFIVDRSEYMDTTESYCQHCEETVTWNLYTKTGEFPSISGHYILQNDITLSGAQIALPEDCSICVDLNGKVVTKSDGGRMIALFNPGCKLAIMDNSQEQTGAIKASGEGDQGLCVWLRYGEFHLYSGTLDASEATTKIGGAAVGVDANTYMYMHGGTIIGGEAPCIYNEAKNVYNRGIGGAMLISGKFVMNGGTITGGRATSIVTYNAKGQAVYNRGFGGNIYANGSATLELNGGVIKNGYAGRAGGNIYLDGTADMTLSGTAIQGGRVDGRGTNGGSIYVGAKATVTMSGGSIAGGSSRNEGGNIYCGGTFTMTGGYIGGGVNYNYTTGEVKEDSASRNFFLVNGTLNMYGGTIVGGLHAIDTSKTKETVVNLAGSPIINGGENTKTNLTLNTNGDGVTLKVGKLSDYARIGVTSVGIFSEKTDASNADNFFSDIGGDVLHYQECLAVGRLGCICGSSEHFGACDGTQQLWMPHNKTNTLPVTTGYWYLTEDIQLAGQQNIKGLQDVALDLNGHTVTTAENRRAYAVYDEKEPITLTITDSSSEKTGAIKAVGTAVDVEGQCVWLRTAGQTLNLYGGILDGSGAVSSRRGTLLCANTGTIVNMYGGTIQNGTAQATYRESSKTVVNGCGGNVFVNGVFNMYGGTITGGKALSGLDESKETITYVGGLGGNLATGSAAQVKLLGGVISDGISHAGGGNVYIDGTKDVLIAGTQLLGGSTGNAERKLSGAGGNLYIAGSVTVEAVTAITGGTGLYNTNGGNIYVNAKGSLTLNGVTVSGGKAERGGNIASFGPITLNKATVTGGSAGTGGNIFLYGAKAAASLNGGTVEKGTATASGGNLHIGADSASLVVDGTTILGGTAASGGNLSVAQKTAVQLRSGVISGGSATNGGNIHASTGTLTLSGATVEAGTATASGGNIYLNSGLEATLSAGTVTGGKAGDGGNVFVNTGAVLNLTGGTVEKGCVTKDGAGNIDVRGTLNMTGGTVTGGCRVDAEGKVVASSEAKRNVFAYRATVNISGGKIDGGMMAHTELTKLNLSADACIVSSQEGKPSLTLNAGALITLEQLSEKAKIVLSNSENTQIATGGSKTALVSDRGLLITNDTDGSLWLRGHTHCSAGCGGTDGVHVEGCTGADEGWIRWTGGAITESGFYCLHTEAEDGKLTLKTQVNIGAGLDVTLCLNGKTLSASARAFLIRDGGSLTVMDCTGGGVIEGKGNSNDSGAVICVIEGKLNLHGGTVRQITDESVTVSGGGAIRVDAKGEMNLYGGSVIGGTVTGVGGAIRTAGTLNICGGTVTGGTAANGGAIGVLGGTVTMNAGTITGGTAAGGGNVHVASGSFTMTGGTVTGGTATSLGGNVAVAKGAQFTLSGGSVEDGVVTVDGAGNVDVRGSFTMNGGTVSDGTRQGWGLTAKSNIFVNGGAAEISGGTIDGGMMIHSTASTLKVSKDACIVSGDAAKPSLTLNADAMLTVDGSLNSSSSIVLSNSEGVKIASGGDRTALSSDKGLLVSVEADGLYLRSHTHCVSCGGIDGGHAADCQGFEEAWTRWTGSDITESGKYCVHEEITVTTLPKVTAEDVTLLVEGKVSATRRALTLSGGAKMTILGTGTIEAAGIDGESNGVIAVGDAQLTLKGVTVQRTADSTAAVKTGGVIGISGGTVIMESGTIQNGSAINGGSVYMSSGSFTMNGGTIQNSTASNGGNVYVASGSFTLSGGTIQNGTAINGGNVCVYGGSFTLSSGIISGGTATPASGTNTASGGNVRIEKGAQFTLAGGSIETGKMADSVDGAGNIDVRGTFIMTDGIVSGGYGVDANGNPITKSVAKRNLFAVNGTVGLSGGTIDGGVMVYGTGSTLKVSKAAYIASGGDTVKPSLSLSAGALLSVDGSLNESASIVISNAADTKISSGGSHAYKANITSDKGLVVSLESDGMYLRNHTHCSLNCGQLNGIHAEGCQGLDVAGNPYTGGAISASGTYCVHDLTIAETAVIGGTEKIAVTLELYGTVTAQTQAFKVENADVTITGSGSIQGSGSYSGDGGLIYVDGGSVTMYSGTLTGGTANQGGNVYVASGSFCLAEDGDETTVPTITQGTASGRNGGNVYVASGAVFTLECGSITQGVAVKDGPGNVYVKGTLNVSGGKISGGYRINDLGGAPVSAGTAKRNVFVFGGALNMSGGQIDGGVMIHTQASTLKLSGEPIIVSNESDKPSLTLSAGSNGVTPVITVSGSGLSDKANIQLSGAAAGVLAVSEDATALTHDIKKVFGADDDGFLTVDTTQYRLTLESDNKLYLRSADAHVHCLCGRTDGSHATDCGGWDVVYTAWNETGSLPDNGAYYLSLGENETVTLTGQHWLGSNTDTSLIENLTLCLNGETVQTASDATERVIMVWTGSTLTLTDCGTTGTVKAGAAVAQDGGCVYVAGTMTMYNGTITGGSVTSNKNGGNVDVPGVMNLHGGTISNGRATNSGGNLRVRGTLNMTGGTITGGEILSGGNVSPDAGHTPKRNIFVYQGTLNMSGGQIDGGVMIHTQASTLKLSGEPVIVSKEGDTRPSLTLNSGPVITIAGSGLSEKANIRITGLAANTVFARAAEDLSLTETMAARFTHDSGYTAKLENNQLLFVSE